MKRLLFAVVMGWAIFYAVPAVASNDSPDVQQAQNTIWNIEDQLADARCQLSILRLDAEKNKIQAALQQTAGTPSLKSAEWQNHLQALEHQRSVELERKRLTHEYIKANRASDRTEADRVLQALRDLH